MDITERKKLQSLTEAVIGVITTGRTLEEGFRERADAEANRARRNPNEEFFIDQEELVEELYSLSQENLIEMILELLGEDNDYDPQKPVGGKWGYPKYAVGKADPESGADRKAMRKEIRAKIKAKRHKELMSGKK